MKCVSCQKRIPNSSHFCNYCGAQQSVRQTLEKATKRRTKSANGTGYAYKRGKTWTLRIRTYTGVTQQNGHAQCIERTRGGFKSKAEALEYLSTLKTAKKVKGSLTLAYYWDNYALSELPKLSRSKQVNYRTAYSRMKALWPVPVSDITVAMLRETTAPYTSHYAVNDMRNLYSRLFKLAAADDPEVNKDLPSFIITPEHTTAKQQVAFTEQEIGAVYALYLQGNLFAGCVLLMIYTSMMPGELMQLTPDKIDFEHRRIVNAGIKTKARKQAVILFPDWFAPILKDIVNHSPGPTIFPQITNHKKFSRMFKQMVDYAGLNPALTPYSCRHTTQTVLGLDPTTSAATRALVMRHSIRQEDRYTHIEERHAQDAVDNMPKPITTHTHKPPTQS